MPRLLPLLLACLPLAGFVPAAAETRPLQVLFLGSENKFNHDPLTRFRTVRRALGSKGVHFTYSETLDALTPANLAHFDAFLLFANHDTITPAQQRAMLGFVRDGKGAVFLHCASACFKNIDFPGFTELVGARFKSHTTGVFRPSIIEPDHPVMAGFPGFEAWDETYTHKDLQPGLTVLQKRDDEPWTWIHLFGKGRVFYSASGHDHRVWELPEFHDLVHRALRWTSRLESPQLPALTYRKAAVPENPENPVGPLNQIQHPLSPADSLKLAQVAPGFELSLFASEPDIVNPIAINWDHRGRLWAVEAYDYPHKVESDEPQDRIKILEDTDADGRADKVTVFSDGLNICTSVLPMPDGAITTDGRDMVYLRDLDRDGRADRKDVLFTGINLRDTHACVSNLHHGFDNWVYATVGYSGIDVTVGGKRHQSSQGAFRFKPDGSQLEVLQNTTNNTWGLAFTEHGELIGSTANGNPSWYLSVPNRHFAAAGLNPPRTPRADDEPRAFPVTTDYFQNWPKEVFSSASGHAVVSGKRFPPTWTNRRALVCEPPLHLVAAPVVENHGTAFRTTGFEQNLYASADAWSAPAAAAVGPDGAVWIADWYNPICNNNPYRKHQKRGPGNAFRTDDRDRTHGRIYRIYPAGSPDTPAPDLSAAPQQIAALAHPNQFWRLAAQKLLAHSPPKNLQPLVKLAAADTHPASLHALHLLSPSKSPDLSRSQHRGIATASTARLTDPEKLQSVLNSETAHPLTRKAAALALADLPKDPALGTALANLTSTDPHLHTAVQLAATKHLATGRPAPEPAGKLSDAAERGRDIYLNCIACHQPDGKGLANIAPPLDASPRVTGPADGLVKTVLHGQTSDRFPAPMPGHAPILTEAQIADVLTYIRTAWSNDAPEVSPESVTTTREATRSRTTPDLPQELTRP